MPGIGSRWRRALASPWAGLALGTLLSLAFLRWATNLPPEPSLTPLAIASATQRPQNPLPSPSPTPAPTKELLRNGDFERWRLHASEPVAGWTFTGLADVEPEEQIKHFGQFALRLSTASDGREVSLRQGLGASRQLQGVRLTFQAWIYATVPRRVRIALTDSGELFYSAFHLGQGRWELLSLVTTIQHDRTDVQAQLWIERGSPTTAYIDDASVVGFDSSGRPLLRQPRDHEDRGPGELLLPAQR